MAPLVICNGVYRSGSTWSFNVCRELFQIDGGKCTSRYLDLIPLERFVVMDWPKSSTASVVKAHHLGVAAMTAVSRGDAKAVYTYRDPRDCVASDFMFMKSSLENSIRRVSQTMEPLRVYRSSPKVHLVRYEEMMRNPEAEIEKIAKYLGVSVDSATIEQINSKTGIHACEQVCRNLKTRPTGELMMVSTHLVDPITHLHENHINGGIIGRWRTDFSCEKAAYVSEFFRYWLLHLGYETPQSLNALPREPADAGPLVIAGQVSASKMVFPTAGL